MGRERGKEGGRSKRRGQTCCAVLKCTNPSFLSRSVSIGRTAGSGEGGGESRIL